MLCQLFVSFLFLKTVSSQINGEFWWLHEKVAQLQHVEPPAPKFEDISEFDTDESAKVVFEDNDFNIEEFNKERNISLNEGEILPGLVYFNLAQPFVVEREVPINKTNTINKSHENYKINFVTSKKELIKTDNQIHKVINNTKNEKITINGEVQPDFVYYKLKKPISIENEVLINHKNKILFGNDENYIKQFVPSDLKEETQKDNSTQKTEDEFRFIFPDNDEYFWGQKIKPIGQDTANKEIKITDIKNNLNTNKTLNNFIRPNKTQHSGKIAISDKIEFDEDRKQTESESICSFLTKHECIRNKGIIHMAGLCQKNSLHDYHKICCILPLFGSIGSKIANSNRNNHVKRYKRSDPAEKINSALQQRNALLQRKSSSNVHKSNHATTTIPSKPVQKIVTPGDYVDPYWNIKNSKFRHQMPQSNANKDYENTKYDNSKEYAEDYTVEVPRPGLIGFYADQERLTSWKMKNKAYSYDGYDEVSEEDSGEGDIPFGYSTFDPRQGQRKKVTPSRTTKRKPQRLMATSEDDSGKDSESQTINYHSNPDFHVLQGFKLVNLVANKNRLVRKTPTESLCDNNQESSNYHLYSDVENPDDIYDDTIDLDQQIYNNCGKSSTNSFKISEEETNDPWLALVVLTKSPQTILCYATIVHPRAAITAANCVHGKIPGDVTILTGLLNLKKDKEESQHRMASVHINSDFKAGDLANDLALLYWKRPFQLEASIQPVCLSDPHVGDDCYFVGWGGYDQALQHRPNSQQATILTPRSCNEKLSAPEVDLPPGAFCASVASRGTVTGIGGPLLCKGASSRVSIVGVAVYRENVVVLLPTFEFVVSALRTHQII